MDRDENRIARMLQQAIQLEHEAHEKRAEAKLLREQVALLKQQAKESEELTQNQ